MVIGSVEINNNPSIVRLNPSPREENTDNPPNSHITGNHDQFTFSINTREIYDLRLSHISLFFLLGGVELLRDLRNEKDPEIRNAVVRELINKLAKEIKDLYLYGLLFGMSDKDLRKIAKELKGICKEIDLMLKDGLVQLDFMTTLNYGIWVKGFVNQYGQEEDDEESNRTNEVKSQVYYKK